MTTVTVTQVTDPACTWCWGSEPFLRRLEETYRDQIRFEYVMGGLIEDFDSFQDAANGISEPREVAPHWSEAGDQHGMPVDETVWLENPPLSTYPASTAFKAAETQGHDLANRYLRRLREAVAAEGRNIAERDVLVELAADVGLDTDEFEDALDGDEAKAAFEADRQFVREVGATGFPTFKIETPDGERWLSGFRRYEVLREAVTRLAPGMDEHDPRPPRELVRHYGRLATREVAEIYDIDFGRATQLLRALRDENSLTAVRCGDGYFWEPADGNTVASESDAVAESPSDSVGGDGDGGPRCGIDGRCTTDWD